MNQIHGLCQNCVSKCTDTLSVSKNESECHRCKENEPEVILEDEGLTIAICYKCHLKELALLKNKSDLPRESNLGMSLGGGFYRPVQKSQYMNKGFLVSEGKMIRKIQKFLNKYEGKLDDLLRQLLKRTLIPSPITWQKIVMKCDKVSSLMYIFISKYHIVGCFHCQPVRIGEKSSVEDQESGFFISERSKIDIQFYRATKDVVVYNKKNKIISLGSPSGFDVIFEGDSLKIKAEIVPSHTEWIYQFIYKL